MSATAKLKFLQNSSYSFLKLYKGRFQHSLETMLKYTYIDDPLDDPVSRRG